MYHRLVSSKLALIAFAVVLSSVVTSAQSSIITTVEGGIGGFEIFDFLPNGQEASVPLETRTPKNFVVVYAEALQNWDMPGMMEQIKGVETSATYIGASLGDGGAGRASMNRGALCNTLSSWTANIRTDS